jgi:hypothetical protein
MNWLWLLLLGLFLFLPLGKGSSGKGEKHSVRDDKNLRTKAKTKSDDYGASDSPSPEEFWSEHREDFLDYDEAEDYWLKHH